MRFRILSALLAATALALPAAADSTMETYEAMGLDVGDVLSGKILSARVLPGEDKQEVAVVTYFTGEKDPANAVNVRLEVFGRNAEGKLQALYSRDLGAEKGGYVGRGELQLLDLDRDDIAEIILTYDDVSEPLVEQSIGEVILHDESGFKAAWTGPVKYDATKAARKLPVERRDRYTRELDIVSTLRSKGITLFFTKRMIAVAGERLEEPKVVQETFPLKPPPEGW